MSIILIMRNGVKSGKSAFKRIGDRVSSLGYSITRSRPLIVHDLSGTVRCMSFGEFENAYKTSKEGNKFDAFTELFKNFHPKTRPVLWRVLINQAHIYEALLRTSKMKLTNLENGPALKLLKPMSKEERLDFDWRQSNEKPIKGEKTIRDEKTIEDKEVLKHPFDAVYGYLREHLGPQFTD